MYPRIRVDKLHPDGSLRASWESYRVDDHDGAIRVFAPGKTHRVHVNGHWVPDSPILTTWRPGEPYVIASWEETEATELYIDISREVIVTPGRFAYVDLYLDVMHRSGRTWSKDEELLARLDPAEAERVLSIRDDLMRAIDAREAPFYVGHPRWQVPVGARALPPGRELTLS